MTSALLPLVRRLPAMAHASVFITDSSTTIGSALREKFVQEDVRTHFLEPENRKITCIDPERGENDVHEILRCHQPYSALKRYFSEVSPPNAVFYTGQPFSKELLGLSQRRRSLYKEAARQAAFRNTEQVKAFLSICEPLAGNSFVSRHFFIDEQSGLQVPGADCCSKNWENLRAEINERDRGHFSATSVRLDCTDGQGFLEDELALRVDDVATRLMEMAFADETPPLELTWREASDLEGQILAE